MPVPILSRQRGWSLVAEYIELFALNLVSLLARREHPVGPAPIFFTYHLFAICSSFYAASIHIAICLQINNKYFAKSRLFSKRVIYQLK